MNRTAPLRKPEMRNKRRIGIGEERRKKRTIEESFFGRRRTMRIRRRRERRIGYNRVNILLKNNEPRIFDTGNTIRESFFLAEEDFMRKKRRRRESGSE